MQHLLNKQTAECHFKASFVVKHSAITCRWGWNGKSH